MWREQPGPGGQVVPAPTSSVSTARSQREQHGSSRKSLCAQPTARCSGGARSLPLGLRDFFRPGIELTWAAHRISPQARSGGQHQLNWLHPRRDRARLRQASNQRHLLHPPKRQERGRDGVARPLRSRTRLVIATPQATGRTSPAAGGRGSSCGFRRPPPREEFGALRQRRAMPDMASQKSHCSGGSFV